MTELTQYGSYADSDSAKLLLLASWLDEQDDERRFDGPREVQKDLRRIAHTLAAATHNADTVAAKLHATTDASVWAEEFVRIVVETEPGVTVDFGLMVAWFANAIEVGRIAGRSEPAVDLVHALEALRLTVEYVGLDTLHPGPGWSWFDVLSQRPEYADWLDSMVNPIPVEIDPNDLVTDAHIDGQADA